jgi:hypothetical protein
MGTASALDIGSVGASAGASFCQAASRARNVLFGGAVPVEVRVGRVCAAARVGNIASVRQTIVHGRSADKRPTSEWHAVMGNDSCSKVSGEANGAPGPRKRGTTREKCSSRIEFFGCNERAG